MDDDIALVKALRDEVQALNSKCNMLEKNVKHLESMCGTHERTLETFRQNIIRVCSHLEILDTSYQGEEFELVS